MHKDAVLLEKVPSRAVRVTAPPAAWPTGKTIEESLAEFEILRNEAIQLAATTSADLRAHFAEHPFLKELDAYQWFMMLPAHAERHLRQAEEVKTNPGFPRQ